MMTCKELSDLVAGDRLPRESWGIRLAVRFHLLLCRHCRNYVMQLRTIGAEARRRWSAPGPEESPLGSLERRIVQEALQNAATADHSEAEDDESLPK